MDTELGYMLRLFIPGTDKKEVVIESMARESYHIILDSQRPNDAVEMYFVQVRTRIIN